MASKIDVLYSGKAKYSEKSLSLTVAENLELGVIRTLATEVFLRPVASMYLPLVSAISL
jgi:hypothetical protein